MTVDSGNSSYSHTLFEKVNNKKDKQLLKDKKPKPIFIQMISLYLFRFECSSLEILTPFFKKRYSKIPLIPFLSICEDSFF